MKQKGKKSGKKAGKKRGGGAARGQKLILYAGNVLPVGFPQATDSYKVRMTAATPIASAAITGNIQSNLQNAANGFLDWSSFAALFVEYRVLCHRVTWVPNYLHFGQGANTLIQAPVIISLFRDAAGGTPASLAGAWDDGGAVVRQISERFAVQCNASGLPEMAWLNTRTPGPTWAINITADALTVSTVYGSAMQELLVEFRGRF